MGDYFNIRALTIISAVQTPQRVRYLKRRHATLGYDYWTNLFCFFRQNRTGDLQQSSGMAEKCALASNKGVSFHQKQQQEGVCEKCTLAEMCSMGRHG